MIEPTNTEGYFGSKDQHAAWVVESIWGHRLETQPPPAMLMEFLGMAEGMHRQGKLLEHTTPGGNHEYSAYQSLQLRNILFNNARMEEIQRDSQGNDSEAWSKWLKTMTNGASTGLRLKPDFAYLKNRFDTFDDLVAVVKLLRRIVMSSGTDSKWTTQFLFPIGTAAYYDALTQKGDGFERDRSVFTRTGEIAYLMLTRAPEPLRLGIKQKLEAFFSRDTDRNRLLMRLISTDTPDCGDPKSGTYLPHKTHPAFERFAEDFLALLSLDLQNQDIHQHLPLLISFHVYLYALETANHWIDQPALPSIVCEILAPRRDLVRKAAVSSYGDNDALGSRAVRRFMETRVFGDTALQAQLASTDFDDQAKTELLSAHLKDTCSLDTRKQKLLATTPAELTVETLSYIDSVYRTGAAKGIQSMARNCGLASNRGTNRYRYAPTDELLQVLVLSNVKGPVEESDFLRILHRRYRIAIGPLEAREVLDDYQFEDSAFEKNKERLSQHLIGIGLAHRMSDACTYIVNPMENYQ
jgi:hypothetical protein